MASQERLSLSGWPAVFIVVAATVRGTLVLQAHCSNDALFHGLYSPALSEHQLCAQFLGCLRPNRPGFIRSRALALALVKACVQGMWPTLIANNGQIRENLVIRVCEGGGVAHLEEVSEIKRVNLSQKYICHPNNICICREDATKLLVFMFSPEKNSHNQEALL